MFHTGPKYFVFFFDTMILSAHIKKRKEKIISFFLMLLVLLSALVGRVSASHMRDFCFDRLSYYKWEGGVKCEVCSTYNIIYIVQFTVCSV